MIRSAAAYPHRRILWLMVALLIIAFFLRVHNLEVVELNRDEMASWARTAQPNLYAALANGAIDSMWPAYHIPLYAFVRLAGVTEFALRIPSVLAGTLALTILYQVGRRFYSVREGLMAALFAAVVPTQIDFSQTARTYALLVVFSLLSVYTWIGLLRACERGQERPWRLAAAYAFSAVMVIYLHLLGAFLILMQGVGTLLWMWNRRQLQGAVLASLGATFVCVIPLGLTIPATMGVYNGWITPAGSVIHATRVFGLDAFGVPRPDAGLLVAVACILLLLGIAQNRRSAPVVAGLPPPTWLLILWVIIPAGVLYLFAVLAKPAFVPRYISYTFPAIYLLLAHLINRLRVGLGWKAGVAIGVAALCVMDFLPTLWQPPSPDVSNMRQATRELARLDDLYPGSLFIWFSGVGDPSYPDFEYYLRRAGSSRSPDIRGGMIATIPDVQAALDAKQPRHVWYFQDAATGDHEFNDFLNKTLVLVDRKQFGPLDIWIYENTAAPK